MEAIRTARVMTALKNGYWDSYSGSWSTKPSSVDDLVSWGSDHAAIVGKANPGEFVYRVSGQPGANGLKQADYPAKN